MIQNIAFYWGNIPVPTFGGIDRVTLVLAKALKEKGFKVFCIYSGGSKNKLSECFVDKFKYEKPEVQYKTLEAYLLANDIQLVINQRYQDAAIVRNLHLATKPHGIKLYTVFHSSPGFQFIITEDGVKRILRKVYNEMVLKRRMSVHYNEIANFSDKVIFLSKPYVRLFQKEYAIKGIDVHKFAVIPNPCTIDSGNIAEKEKIVLVVSRLEETTKKITYILKIWNSIRSRFPDWQLVFVGEGPSQDEYMAYCAAHHMDNVQFVGRQEPLSYYAKASVFMMTSSFEGWPLTIVEAMTNGVVPIVMDSFAAVHDIIDDGKDGYITPNKDLNAYAEKLSQLMQNKKLRETISNAARQKAKTFSPEKVIEKWISLFDGEV